ncbi:MAG: hypothetical protein ACREQC_16700 [Candidatus Binataceae bacterium]
MNWTVPTIGGIQRLAAILTIAASATLFVFVSRSAALGCIAGGLLMIVNLYLLMLVGKTMIALAENGGGAVGAIIAPLKLMLFVVAAYLIISRLHIDLLGFTLGVLTQFAAIFIETGRVSIAGAISAEEQKA